MFDPANGLRPVGVVIGKSADFVLCRGDDPVPQRDRRSSPAAFMLERQRFMQRVSSSTQLFRVPRHIARQSIAQVNRHTLQF